MVSKLAQAERTTADGKLAVQRLQEDNLRLRRTLEQSMTRINRMSLDSDYSVDRWVGLKNGGGGIMIFAAFPCQNPSHIPFFSNINLGDVREPDLRRPPIAFPSFY